jgi:UDP-N-acetyl-D-glucosamine dehydrogenase
VNAASNERAGDAGDAIARSASGEEATAAHAALLLARIADRTARIGVVGQGYVGLPLAVALAEQGFPVLGIDVSEARVATINTGRSPIGDVSDARLSALVAAGRFRATTDAQGAADCDVRFVCVPTPFDRNKTPDLTYVHAAADGIAATLRPGQLVVLQSTTYPGTTDEAVRPRLEQGGLAAGRDFFLAFVPERIDPGDPEHTVETTPKVVGGMTAHCTAVTTAVLATLGATVMAVSSPRVAELTKLLENVFRAVNIALVNELAVLCEQMGIDVWEVIGAAATKPFGFMPFWPGPGVGGHCIPVDPWYLSWKAREYDFPTRFIELAAEVNQRMPAHVVDLVVGALSGDGKPLAGADVLVIGVAFKPNVADPRLAPAERVIALLLAGGARVRYHDPHIARFHVGGDVFLPEPTTLDSEPLTDDGLAAADTVVLLVAHRAVDIGRITRHARLVVDACNATAGHVGGARVVRLGAPAPGP